MEFKQRTQSSSTPGGHPDLLFYIPSSIGYSNQGLPVDCFQISMLENIIGISHHPVFKDKDLHDLLICYMHIHHLQVPMDAEKSLKTYVRLLRYVSNDKFVVTTLKQNIHIHNEVFFNTTTAYIDHQSRKNIR